MQEKIENKKTYCEKLADEYVLGCEGKQWMTKALQAAGEYRIANRLGFSNDSVEGFLCSAFLGIRFLRQYEGVAQESIKKAKLLGEVFIDYLLVKVKESYWGIESLENAVSKISEDFEITVDRKRSIEIAINVLTAEYFYKNRMKLSSEVRFNPDRSMLEKWEERWKPEFLNK